MTQLWKIILLNPIFLTFHTAWTRSSQLDKPELE